MCDVAHEVLRGRAERAALAVFQAEVIAKKLGADVEPVPPEAHVAEWERWLVHDPADTDEARTEARLRELMEEVA